ncbi:hypothetical protein Tco_1031818 [Tanacetum coccineum]|uniref:Transposase n=1 Tax=Tanacetum coccineum TaxID=301880 RepID=A0ABQ5GCD6_9ASTR
MEPEVIDIDDVPVSGDQIPKTVSRSKRKCKRKEVPVHEIIDVDMDEDPIDVVFIQGKAKSNKKMKGAMGISLGFDSAFPIVFCLKINHGGAFTPPPKIRYKGGKVNCNTLKSEHAAECWISEGVIFMDQ